MTSAVTPSGPMVETASNAIASTETSTAPIDVQATARRFPADFVWGVATSSFQIEGDRAGRGESIWDRFCTVPGAILDGSNGDVACAHHEHAAADVQLMSELGLDAYRFSISWPRVIPNGHGDVAADGLDFYSRLVDELLAAGIEPYVTLYHWDLPQVLEDRGRLARASDCAPLRRVRRRRGVGPRRPGQAVGHAQRAVLLELLRIRHGVHGSGVARPSPTGSPPPITSCSVTAWPSSACAPAFRTPRSVSS